MGIHSADERQRYLDTGSYEPVEDDGTRPPSSSTTQPPSRAGRGGGRVEAEAQVADAEARSTAQVAETARPAPRQAHTSAELLEEITGSAVDARCA